MSIGNSIKNENDPIYFQDYLSKYPQGQFVNIARLKAKPRQTAPHAPVATSSASAIDSASIPSTSSSAAYRIGGKGPGGGIVYYVDSSGVHGLEAQAKDEPQILNWNQAIAAARAHGSGWHLPTKEELNLLYQKKDVVGGFDYSNSYYWSSTEDDADDAWFQDFISTSGYQTGYLKDYPTRVRAVRAF